MKVRRAKLYRKDLPPDEQELVRLVRACILANSRYGFMFTHDANDIHTERVFVNMRHLTAIENAVAAIKLRDAASGGLK